MVTWELILFILFILNVKIFSTIKGFFFKKIYFGEEKSKSCLKDAGHLQ